MKKSPEVQSWESFKRTLTSKDRLPIEEQRNRLAYLIVNNNNAERESVSLQAEAVLRKLLKL